MSAVGLEPLPRPTRIGRRRPARPSRPAGRRSARILDRAEGNPFFLEEIVRHLIDLGRIVRGATAGGRRRADDVELPDTVHGVLAARIDLLRPASKRVLQAAAVVGRMFWPAGAPAG